MALQLQLDGHKKPWSGLVPVCIVIPATCRAIIEDVRVHVKLQLADAALAAEQYRLKHGRWPDALDHLVPEFLSAVPEDPFAEGKVRMVRTNYGLVVYSVGQDRSDNGGVTQEEWNKAKREAEAKGLKFDYRKSYDIAFRLVDPDKRGATQRTFKEECADAEISVQDLLDAGYTPERLKELGFADEDIARAEREE